MPFSGGKQGFFCIQQPKKENQKKTKQQKQQKQIRRV